MRRREAFRDTGGLRGKNVVNFRTHQEPELRCPLCGETSPAREWILRGSVASHVRIVDGTFEIEDDAYADFFISHLQCPRCGEEFQLPDGQQFSLPYYHVETGEYLEKLRNLELGG